MSAASVKPGIPFVVAAPSGTGKTTVCAKLVERDGQISVSVSHTTRTRRQDEADGSDYFFVDAKEFQRLIAEDALPNAEERLQQSEAVARFLVDAGYRRIGLDHFARPEDPLAKAQGVRTLHRNFQGYTTDAAEAMFGLGASAIGRLPQGYVQNAVPMRAYAAAIRAGRFAVCRGLALGSEDRLRGAVIEGLMCDLTIDLAEQGRRYDAPEDVFAREAPGLQAMARDGLVELEGARVRVTEAGRPFLRSVCALFDRYLATGQGRHSRAV